MKIELLFWAFLSKIETEMADSFVLLPKMKE